MKWRIVVLAMLVVTPTLSYAQRSSSAFHANGRAILRELVETNTTASSGNTTFAARKMAARFLAAGFPQADVQIVGPADKNRNLVVRYRGRGAARPVLLLAHLDVVEARREDWSFDPFTLTERDGYFYGRGTQDQKGGAAALVAALLRMKQEGVVPRRDLILALTAGEEGGMTYNGVEWLLKSRRDLIDAEYAINVDAGGGEMENGKHTILDVQAAEKVYHTVTLTVRNPGGHSSLPRTDNAIYELAAALERLASFDFPARPSALTRAYFGQAAVSAAPALAADMAAIAQGRDDSASIARLSRVPLYNSILRTTCVATRLAAGHADNALPQTATATVNCRMLPSDRAADVERTLVRIIADTGVHLAPTDTAHPSPESPLRPDVFKVIDATVRQVWGPMPIVPYMETGATDGLYLRNAGIPVYGFNGLFIPIDDVRAHGRDERILVTAFDESLDFTYTLLRNLTSAPRP